MHPYKRRRTNPNNPIVDQALFPLSIISGGWLLLLLSLSSYSNPIVLSIVDDLHVHAFPFSVPPKHPNGVVHFQPSHHPLVFRLITNVTPSSIPRRQRAIMMDQQQPNNQQEQSKNKDTISYGSIPRSPLEVRSNKVDDYDDDDDRPLAPETPVPWPPHADSAPSLAPRRAVESIELARSVKRRARPTSGAFWT